MISQEDRVRCYYHTDLAIKVREFTDKFGITSLLWAIQRGLTDTAIGNKDYDQATDEYKNLSRKLHEIRIQTPECLKFKEEFMELINETT